MEFKNFILVLSVFFIISCERGTDIVGGGVERIGFKLSSSVSVDSKVYVVDKSYPRIFEFSVEPMEKTGEIEIPENYIGGKLLVGPNAEFFLLFKNSSFAIIGRDGVRAEEGLNYDTEIESAAFDPETRRLVLLQVNGAVELAQLGKNGEIEKSWSADLKFKGDDVVKSGVLMPNGDLVLSVSSGALVVVDFEETLAKEKWSYESINLLDDPLLDGDDYEEASKDLKGGVAWLSKGLESNDSIILGIAWSTMFTFDLDSKKIVDLKRAAKFSRIVTVSSEGPHFFVFGERIVDDQLVTVDSDAKLKTRKFKAKLSEEYAEPTFTHLDVANDTLLIVAAKYPRLFDVLVSGLFPNGRFPGEDLELTSIRLSDGKVKVKKRFGYVDDFALLGHYLINFRISPRGYAERFDIDEDTDAEVCYAYKLESYMNRK